jgi:hypothetical protein
MRGVAKAKATRDEITAAVDVLERLTYRIDDQAEAAISGTGKWFLNEERATQITHRAVQRIEIVDEVIRELKHRAFTLE